MSRYIDADKLKKDMCIPVSISYDETVWLVNKTIDDQPTADVRENVRATLRDDHGNYRCTNCNALISDEIDFVLEGYKPIQFCPNCGADMRGEQDG